MSRFRGYLGDGLYVELGDDGQVRLYASDGIKTTNEVFLDSCVLGKFAAWVKTVSEETDANRN